VRNISISHIGIENGLEAQRGYHTIVAEVDIANVAIVQPLERTRNVNVEVKVVLVLSFVDSLKVADDVLMDISGEWLRGLDLVVDGRVEVKDPS